jgi:hypothetical protein
VKSFKKVGILVERIGVLTVEFIRRPGSIEYIAKLLTEYIHTHQNLAKCLKVQENVQLFAHSLIPRDKNFFWQTFHFVS